MKSIFDGAKFGDRFETENGLLAIYWGKVLANTTYKHELAIKFENAGTPSIIRYYPDGQYMYYKACPELKIIRRLQ